MNYSIRNANYLVNLKIIYIIFNTIIQHILSLKNNKYYRVGCLLGEAGRRGWGRGVPLETPTIYIYIYIYKHISSSYYNIIVSHVLLLLSLLILLVL